jgi:Domain of unknown function (DUF4276)
VGFGTATTWTRAEMHIEFLVEDRSGGQLIEILVPKLIGEFGSPHTWKVHAYDGVGRIDKNLDGRQDPSKRQLLNQLPRLLKGYGRTPGFDLVVVIVDSDNRDCKKFLAELRDVLANCSPAPRTLFRLAIEEIEAWYLGDKNAITNAYPSAIRQKLNSYRQDSVCGTWERLSEALAPRNARIRQPMPRQSKSEWARRIGPLMNVEVNDSPSFQRFRDGLRNAVGYPVSASVSKRAPASLSTAMRKS